MAKPAGKTIRKPSSAKKTQTARQPAAAKAEKPNEVEPAASADELDAQLDEPNDEDHGDSDAGDELDESKANDQVEAEPVAVKGHLEGCPADRGESYELTSPKGKPVKVTRCIDCGANL